MDAFTWIKPRYSTVNGLEVTVIVFCHLVNDVF